MDNTNKIKVDINLHALSVLLDLHISYMNLCNCIETEEMALILYIHSHNHVNIQCLPTRTVHVCLNLYLPETKHGNQTER